MRALAINCGSSSLKFRLVETSGEGEAAYRPVASGVIVDIGASARLRLDDGEPAPVDAASHTQAVERVLDALGSAAAVDVVGHRVVHGGDAFDAPTRIDDRVVSAIEALEDLAPLHNRPALAAIRAVRDAFGDGVPAVATFDTTFFRRLPERAGLYPIPPEMAAKHRIRRYGFHGLAHRWMSERWASIETRRDGRLITLQLGAGCSASAIEAGRPIDVSMGLTPLEGLMMLTRSGDVDPSLPGYLARVEGIPLSEAEDVLIRRSGLLGVSGLGVVGDIVAAAGRGDERARLALDMFCYRARKYIGAYQAALGGADAIVFGGGIGEHQPEIRRRICDGLAALGVELDEQANAGTVGSEARISGGGSPVAVHVIPVDEEALIVADAVAWVGGDRP